MSVLDLVYDARERRLGPLLRGHLLLFEGRPLPPLRGIDTIAAILLAAGLELLLGPRSPLFTDLGVSRPTPLLHLPLLVAIAIVAARYAAGLGPRALGLVPPGSWSRTETFFFVQVLLLANGVFFVLSGPRLAALPAGTFAFSTLALVVVPQLLWGFYQEIVYRGLVQTALTRRWGSIAGPLVANLAYTLGPLHFYHFRHPDGAAHWLPMLAGVFAIGLYFAVLYHRTRNLWLVGIFHGVGNAWLNGVPQLLAGRG